jgi:hypothetical protein
MDCIFYARGHSLVRHRFQLIVETSDFIPSPNVAEDHQTKNAKSIVTKKGGYFEGIRIDSEFSLVLKRY